MRLTPTIGHWSHGVLWYPLYLWHWPLLCFIRIGLMDRRRLRKRQRSRFLFSFALAWLTYLLVEKPLRFGKSAPIKAAILFAVMGMISAAGYFVYKNNGFAFRNASAEDIVAAAQDYEHSAGADFSVVIQTQVTKRSLVGDSTMGQYFPRVRRLIEQHAIDLDSNRIIFDLEAGCRRFPTLRENWSWLARPSSTRSSRRSMAKGSKRLRLRRGGPRSLPTKNITFVAIRRKSSCEIRTKSRIASSVNLRR